MLQDTTLRDSILLVLANKQDMTGAMEAQEVKAKLDLANLKQRNWFIQPCCATTGEGKNIQFLYSPFLGLFDGMDWLSSNLKDK